MALVKAVVQFSSVQEVSTLRESPCALYSIFQRFSGIVCETRQCLSHEHWPFLIPHEWTRNVTTGMRMYYYHALFSQVLSWLSEHTDLCTWHQMNTTMLLSAISMHTSNVSCSLCLPVCQPVLEIMFMKLGINLKTSFIMSFLVVFALFFLWQILLVQQCNRNATYIPCVPANWVTFWS